MFLAWMNKSLWNWNFTAYFDTEKYVQVEKPW